MEVLLATHNGEKYIEQFLSSLKNQNGVQIDLVVSDDSSSDKTLNIVNSYASSFESLIVLRGPNLGAKANFAHLVQFSNSRFSAFADQDDIWLPNHLRDSIDVLSKHLSTPALVFSSVIEFSEFGKNRVWPQINKTPELPILLTENLARGCTIVLNRELINLLKHSNFNSIYMHDWWATLVAKTCGVIEYINSPTILYRIHEDNAIGKRKPQMARIQLFWRSYFLHRGWVPQDQASQLLAQFGGYMTSHNRFLTNTFANLGKLKFRDRYRFLFRTKISLRQSRMENLVLKLLLLLLPRVRKS